MIYGGKKHSCNSYNSTLMPTPLSDGQIAAFNFRVLITSNHSISTLYQKRFDINTGTGDSDGMFFARALVVLKELALSRSISVLLWQT